MPLDWFWLSLRYAALATLFAVAIGLPLGYVLARRRFAGRDVLNAFVNLPFALPPAVLCYYLLVPQTFHWNAALVLSAVYTLPLPIGIARAGFESVGHDFENAARTLGASEVRIFYAIAAPVAWRALLAATLAAFARAFADFGLTAIFALHAPVAVPVSILGAISVGAFYVTSRLRRTRVAA